MRMKTIIKSIALTFLGIHAAGAGTLIDVDFGAGSGPSSKSGFAATGLTAADFWNFYTRDDGSGGWRTSGNIALNYSDNSSSGAGLTVNNAPGAWANGSSDSMYNDFIFPLDSGNATLTVTNLAAGNYNIYLYSQDGNYTLTVGSRTYGTLLTADWPLSSDPPQWKSGTQYALFANVQVRTNQSVTITVAPGVDGYAIVAGLQIEKASPSKPLTLIDVDFDAGSGPSAKSGFAATGVNNNDFWNFYTRDDGMGGWRTSGNIPNLSYVDTSSSGVGLTVNNAPGAWNNGSSDHMYAGYIYPLSGTNSTFTLTNLPAGNYNFYTYSQDGNYTLTVGGKTYGTLLTADMPLSSDPPNWETGVQYSLFANIPVVAGQSVVITVNLGTAGFAILGGLQIEKVATALIDIDFDAGSGPSAKKGFAATGQTTNDFWNFYTRDDGAGGWRTSGAITNLAYVDHKASSVGLTVNNAPGAWNNGSSDPMYGGYIYPLSGTNATFTLTNLPAGNYNFYLYSQDGNYDLTVGGSFIGNRTTSDMPLSSDPPIWQSGVQYGLFSNISVSSGQSVVVTVKPGVAGYAILAGMQIEPVQP
jgi:hypothetical protein